MRRAVTVIATAAAAVTVTVTATVTGLRPFSYSRLWKSLSSKNTFEEITCVTLTYLYIYIYIYV